VPNPIDVDNNKSLIATINRLANESGSPWVNSATVANALLKLDASAYTGSLKSFLQEISTTGIVFMRGEGVEFEVAIHHSLRTNESAGASASGSSTTFKFGSALDTAGTTAAPGTSGSSDSSKFQSLVDAIRKLESSPGDWVWISRIGSHLGSDTYKANGYTRLSKYLEAAQEAGIIFVRDRGSQKQASLTM
jgi:hypothetical protein